RVIALSAFFFCVAAIALLTIAAPRRGEQAWGGFFGVICTLVGFAGLPLMPIVALLIRWDKEPTPGSYGEWPTIRGSLPRWLRWFETPDERWPGGLYEPAVRDVLTQYGRYVCCLYWYTRNSMHGLLPVFAMVRMETKPTAHDAPSTDNYYQWQAFGLRGGYGWRWKPQNVEGTSWAMVPYFTVRRA
ncbi:MAG: hypothetical protein KGI52_17805, partial [Burkholderiales bacterium]|nr:hypothetical protein [Burkholderiales bacterium]